VLYRDDPIRVRKRGGGYVLSMRLPFVSRDDMDIHRRGEELLVRVGSYRRNLILPATLQRLEVRGANFVGDRLEVGFGHDDGDDVAAAGGGRRRGRQRG
jgi:arsenite/tail-anchored protein-transporting ATPase